jgi:hypothetical protein
VEKSEFTPQMQYTATLQPEGGPPRAENFYVFRTFEQFMIVRLNADGKLHRLRYADVARIVSARSVSPAQRYHVPAALLEEPLWKSRSTMDHYSSTPRSGK